MPGPPTSAPFLPPAGPLDHEPDPQNEFRMRIDPKRRPHGCAAVRGAVS